MALSNAERSARYDAKNRERRRLAAAARRLANPERTKEIKRKSYLAHAERRRAESAAYRAANPERVKEWERRRDKEAQRVRNRAWKEANPERTREHSRKRLRSPTGRLNNRMRARLHRTLRAGGASVMRNLGYTIAELKSHLEKQFLSGMGWENMGEWHIDHVIPLAAFKFETHEDPDFARAWSLTNLRPLWAADNLAKNAKVLTLL